MKRYSSIKSLPYEWPLSAEWSANDTALIVIDMQADFLHENGYFANLGYSVEAGQKTIPVVSQLIDAFRHADMPVYFTREGHRPDLSDLSFVKRVRGEQNGTPIGAQGSLGKFLIRGEKGWDIIDALKPLPDEVVIDKPGNSAFYSTDFDKILRNRGIKHLVLCGVTTDVCVHSTMRDANERGYDCLLIEDACAAGFVYLHQATIDITKNEGGIFGAVSDSQILLASLV